MGWSFGWASGKDLIADLTRAQEVTLAGRRVLRTETVRHARRGGAVYAVIEKTAPEPPGGDESYPAAPGLPDWENDWNRVWWEQSKAIGANGPQRVIGVYLIKNGGEAHGWGYKDMDESMGPNEAQCPLAYLDMVPCPGGFAAEWRERVRSYWAEEAERRALLKSLQVGDRIRLRRSSVKEVTIVSTDPLRGSAGYATYRIPRAMVAGRVEEEARYTEAELAAGLRQEGECARYYWGVDQEEVEA